LITAGRRIAARKSILRAREQKALLVGRQQYVEPARRQQCFDEREIAFGVIAQRRATVIFADEARKPRQAPR
jgi:hypothetical protein